MLDYAQKIKEIDNYSISILIKSMINDSIDNTLDFIELEKYHDYYDIIVYNCLIDLLIKKKESKHAIE